MPDLPQRWLSLSGICTVLNLTPSQVKSLYKQKYLVRIGKNPPDYRYLDPTPEYAERLRLAAVLLSRNAAVTFKIDLPTTFLLTSREVAEIMGWSPRYAKVYLAEKKIPCFRFENSKKRALLFSVSAVRDMIFKRNGRGRYSKQLAPILLSDVILFYRRFQATEEAIVPTDAAFKEDAELQKKIQWMMRQPSPQREVMLADFLDKMELAKQVVEALRSPDDTSTCTDC
jgi:hypothetical protein